jgi:hypothetical protein
MTVPYSSVIQAIGCYYYVTTSGEFEPHWVHDSCLSVSLGELRDLRESVGYDLRTTANHVLSNLWVKSWAIPFSERLVSKRSIGSKEEGSRQRVNKVVELRLYCYLIRSELR